MTVTKVMSGSCPDPSPTKAHVLGTPPEEPSPIGVRRTFFPLPLSFLEIDLSMLQEGTYADRQGKKDVFSAHPPFARQHETRPDRMQHPEDSGCFGGPLL